MIQMTWEALVGLMSVLGAAYGVLLFVRGNDIKMIDNRLTSLEKEITRNREDRLHQLEGVQATSDRIETKVDQLAQAFFKHLGKEQ